MAEFRTTRINRASTMVWPLGYGTTMSAFVVTDELKGVLLRGLPDSLCGAPEQLGRAMPDDVIERIPLDAPALLMRFADKDAVRRHISTLEALLENWEDV